MSTTLKELDIVFVTMLIGEESISDFVFDNSLSDDDVCEYMRNKGWNFDSIMISR